jgi:hypothetical protein
MGSSILNSSGRDILWTRTALIEARAVQVSILAISAILAIAAQAGAPAVHNRFQKNEGDVILNNVSWVNRWWLFTS